MRKLLRVLLAAIFLVPTSMVATPASAAPLSGFEQLSQCIRSEGTSALALFFLIDSSASLRTNGKGGPGSDPNDLRAQILSQSIQQLGALGSDQLKVYFGLTTFDKTSPGRGNASYSWRQATEQNIKDASEWVLKTIPDQDNGSRTDWRAGLAEARKQLNRAPESSGTTCKAILWFTDGELDVDGGAKANSKAIEEMCGADPNASGGSATKGIIAGLRRDKINLIGVLLRAGGSEPNSGLATYFKPIVEGQGQVDASSFGGSSNQQFQCGPFPIPPSYGQGSTLIASDPDDLAREFLRLVLIMQNGVPLPPNSLDQFTVDPGVASVSLVIPASRWTLRGPAGLDLITETSRDSRFKIQVLGNTSVVSFNVSQGFQGNWDVDHSSNERVSVFMQSGLRIVVDKTHSALKVGAGAQDISGSIEGPQGRADLTVYDTTKTKMFVSARDNTDQNRSSDEQAMVFSPDGKWSGTFTPLSGSNRGSMLLRLQLVTKSGVVLPEVLQTYDFDLVVPENLCQIVKSTLTFSDLVYKPHTPATGKLQVKGGNDGKCGIAFSPPRVTKDRIGRTASEFKVSIRDEATQELIGFDQWRQISSGEVKTYIITVDNPQKSNGPIELVLPVKSRLIESEQELESLVTIQFNETAKGHATWAAIVLLILGLGIPFLLLQLTNFFFARYRLENSSVAHVRVKVRINDQGEASLAPALGRTDLLNQRDFGFMPASMKRVKKFQLDDKGLPIADFDAHLPLNPFGVVAGRVHVASTSLVASAEEPKSTSDGRVAGAALNPNGFYFAIASPGAVKRDTDDNIEFEALLTAFLSDLAPQEANERVSSLVENVKDSSIWTLLAQLVLASGSETAMAPAVERDNWDQSLSPTFSVESTSTTQTKVQSVDEDDPWA